MSIVTDTIKGHLFGIEKSINITPGVMVVDNFELSMLLLLEHCTVIIFSQHS